jgi:predicted O-linked N-acetylglucosamine transferase (SPINDLY family)
MGTSYVDYIIADRILIPAGAESHYTEKIIFMPDTYQVNDRRRPLASHIFTRAEQGLPDSGFVFCCFNNNYKIAPQVFDSWMRILTRVEGSVLWLYGENADAVENLKREARTRDVESDRLIFASKVPISEHIARHRLAGLFLDTLPYNAHATASLALWAGLPVLTRIGDTFPGRVGASLLSAIGLPELITTTPGAYEARAVELATCPDQLSDLKAKLEASRLTTPLFDTMRFTRHIEAAYAEMHARTEAGLPKADINVAALDERAPIAT